MQLLFFYSNFKKYLDFVFVLFRTSFYTET